MKTQYSIVGVIALFCMLALPTNAAAAPKDSKTGFEFGLGGHALFSHAHMGDGMKDELIATTADWQGTGGGFGLTFTAMWKGYIGVELQTNYLSHALTTDFTVLNVDQRQPPTYGVSLETPSQLFQMPMLILLSVPSETIRPILGLGMVFEKAAGGSFEPDFTSDIPPEISQTFYVYTQERLIPRFTFGVETKISSEAHDLRASLSVGVNYDTELANKIESDTPTIARCMEYSGDGSGLEINCGTEPRVMTVWQTDVLLGLKYYFP